MEGHSVAIAVGNRARDYGRALESSEEVSKLDTLEKAGKLKRVPFEERDAMKKLADPVMATYAKEIGAEGIFDHVYIGFERLSCDLDGAQLG